MGKGPSYNVPYRRRREGKTNYALRKKLISSVLPRVVTRRTRKHIIVQLVKSAAIGDEVTTSAHSSELKKKYGWLGSLDNLSAAYLTGLLCGHRMIAKGTKEAILDVGLNSPSKGGRIFATLKGLLDAGVEVPHDEETLPDEKRIMGQHIVDYATQMASNSDAYSRMFSKYLSRGLNPENISENFSLVKKRITSEFGKQ